MKRLFEWNSPQNVVSWLKKLLILKDECIKRTARVVECPDKHYLIRQNGQSIFMSDQAMKQASRLKKWAGLVLLYTGNDIECPALMKYYTLGLLGAKQKKN
jgi:hypothetical protein